MLVGEEVLVGLAVVVVVGTMLVGAIVDGAAEVVGVGVGTPATAVVGALVGESALVGEPVLVWASVGEPVVGAMVGATEWIAAEVG